MASRTTRLWKVLQCLEDDDDLERIVPKEFIIGIRCALDAGMSCEQIVSVLVLSAGVYKANAGMLETETLIERATNLARVIECDQDMVRRKREW